MGVVLFEMMNGKHPFQGNSNIDTLHAIVHQDPLKTLHPRVSLPQEILLASKNHR